MEWNRAHISGAAMLPAYTVRPYQWRGAWCNCQWRGAWCNCHMPDASTGSSIHSIMVRSHRRRVLDGHNVFFLLALLPVLSGYQLTIVHNNDVHAHFDETNTRAGECSPQNKADNVCIGGEARRNQFIKGKLHRLSNWSYRCVWSLVVNRHSGLIEK